jgi:hypothetical protein
MSACDAGNGTYRRLQERKNSNSVLLNPDSAAPMDEDMHEGDHKNMRATPQLASRKLSSVMRRGGTTQDQKQLASNNP